MTKDDLISRQPVTHEERTETHACDLISRQAAIDACMKYNGYGSVWACIMGDIKRLPSAEPRKKWKWIDKSGGIEGAWNYCSVCMEQAIDLYDFCPNCGADMRQKEDENV